MYVDINLLQKKKTNYEWLIIGAILFVCAIVLGVFLYSQYSERKAEETRIETALQSELELQKASLSSVEVHKTAEEQMAELVEWANHQPVPTVFLLDHLTSLLPERGFILSFSYTSNSTATFSMQFDSNVEAAYYLRMLKDSAYISHVTLSTIGTISASDETAADEETYFQPRAVADFEITINAEKLKAATSEWEAAQ